MGIHSRIFVKSPRRDVLFRGLFSNKVKKTILLKTNDIISPAVTSLENVGKFARVGSNYDDVTVGGFVFLITPKFDDEFFSKYLLYYFSSPTFILKLKGITKKSGAAFYNINKELFNILIVPVPPYKEMVRIVKKLDEVMLEINTIEEKSNFIKNNI